MDTHVVTRKFSGPGSVELAAGTRIDAADWKNLGSLEATNYVRPLNANEFDESSEPENIAAPRRRGRQPGSKNKPNQIPTEQ